MKLTLKFSTVLVFLFIASFFCCKNNSDKETILKGGTTILVDETLKPIIEDQITVFESDYNAKIVLDARSEKEVSLAFVKDTSRIIVLSRELNEDEKKYFKNLNITPKTTKIGTDAVAFIMNKNSNDTLIALDEVVQFMKGSFSSKIKGLVFDNLNSSTVRLMTEIAGVSSIPDKGVFSFKNNEEVLKFVSENEGMIGVVGLNWLYQPSTAIVEYLKDINVLSVKGIGEKEYFAPTQNNIAEGKYPLARDLFIINCQGYSGLGMGFASFVAGERGQRIILKSGLLPVRVPSRKILIRNNDKK
ncbi:PstS family phosphate ABC transporter substrate-binding protein [Flavobacterium sp. UMI-01]|uniref:PstS family phosphate ABC transporter substrate-binding protein n=1 Tax=Flavobacterium sp. UMI-01 TaxID=1441053 RepID=UPI001C7D7EA8|nr:substrate-binding domain-containing protein [Flavobacterium sp. UMI-01]